MADWVADKAGTKLVQQIDVIAPNRRKDSDGTVGDLAHSLRDSAHNPEDSGDADAPGNPDNQVDAFDVTHDPAHGCDIGVFWENIRASRDRRAKLAIFNRRCFSNYASGRYPAFTWRPYSGSNPHTGHGHIEIDDRYHDQTHEWEISMALSDADKTWLRTVMVEEIRKAVYNGDADPAAGSGGTQMAYMQWNTAAKQATAAAAGITALAEKLGQPGTPSAPFDPETVRPIIRQELDNTRLGHA